MKMGVLDTIYPQFYEGFPKIKTIFWLRIPGIYLHIFTDIKTDSVKTHYKFLWLNNTSTPT